MVIYPSPLALRSASSRLHAGLSSQPLADLQHRGEPGCKQGCLYLGKLTGKLTFYGRGDQGGYMLFFAEHLGLPA